MSPSPSSSPSQAYTFKNNLAEAKVCSLSMPGALGEVWYSWSGALGTAMKASGDRILGCRPQLCESQREKLRKPSTVPRTQ